MLLAVVSFELGVAFSMFVRPTCPQPWRIGKYYRYGRIRADDDVGGC